MVSSECSRYWILPLIVGTGSSVSCSSDITIMYSPTPVCKTYDIVDVGLFVFCMADEEPVDQKKYLEESCKPKCVKPLLEYQACVKRIQGDESGHKHCTGQYFDYWSCVDKCVAPKLFPKLK
ncbi:hypothetical protein L3X38_009033 [Prunus dulcis]|uniref:Complex III subunit VI n=1 Tax=Prunus dulcis TaxID=3755 RepID=A0AAD4ZXL6_PRUDU|nr:hypothetical protein L3X38_009033 [Prunus dulcis]